MLHHFSDFQMQSDDLFAELFEELSQQPPPMLYFPGSDAEIDNTMGVFHLLKAYGEVGPADADLSRVILARLRERSSPVGTTIERVAHHLLDGGSQTEFLAQESAKNYDVAHQAFYQMTPYGRFAHFVANSAIAESVPRDDSCAMRIVDFDGGDGVQWPPLLAALGPHRPVCITFVGGAPEKSYELERTKERLLAFANTMRLNVTVEILRQEQIRVDKSEWLVFNCMAGLPHMNPSTTKSVEFVKKAQEMLAICKNRGLLVHGSGCIGDASFFSDEHLLRCHAMFESMESHFGPKFSLARTAMECLFVGPACRVSNSGVGIGVGFEGVCIGKESVSEAEMIVRGGGDYGVRIGDGEVVLEWRGTPLVRICAWR